MTRLRTEDISDISTQLKQYDHELVRKTGRTLRGIAAKVLGIAEEEFQSIAGSIPVAVVPVLSGQGVISGFSATVRDILMHIGFNAFVTKTSDVAGIAEAVEKGGEIIMMADDLKFIALNLKTGYIIDNSEATAIGFIAGLDLMAGGIEHKKVLIIGCGPVGLSSASAALQRGAQVSVFDVDIRHSQKLQEAIKNKTGKILNIVKSFKSGCIAFQNFDLIVEATNKTNIIHETDICSKTYIAAPGMPLGLNASAVRKISDRLIHDPLQLGVCIMAALAVEGN